MGKIITGIAYSFFDCNVPKIRILEVMPKIRKYASSPESLELDIKERFKDWGTLDRGLLFMIREYGDYRILPSGSNVDDIENKALIQLRYFMTAKYPEHSNEQAAGELGDVLNQIHRLNLQDNPTPVPAAIFRGAVLYEKDGVYYFRR